MRKSREIQIEIAKRDKPMSEEEKANAISVRDRLVEEIIKLYFSKTG